MSVLRGLLAKESRSVPEKYGWRDGMVWGGYPEGSSTHQAMRLSAVFGCLRLLSEAISTLPLDTFERQGGVRKPYRPRPGYLSFDPPGPSRTDVVGQVMLSLLTEGNAYIATPRDRMGTPTSLVVLDPHRISVDTVAGRPRYRAGSDEFGPLEMLHIRGMTMPGSLLGLSPIAYARESIDLGLAAQRFGSSFFANGALPGAVIETEGSMSDEAIRRFTETWNAGHQGVGNASRVGVLTGKAKLTKVSVTPEDSQFLETRQFQVPDIARIFGVPPHLIADASNSTSWGSGLAEQNLAFGQFSLRPWIERIEESLGRLLTTHGLSNVFARLNLDALLRAGTKERYQAHAVGLKYQFLEVNEVRAMEDLPPMTTPPPIIPLTGNDPLGDDPLAEKEG